MEVQGAGPAAREGTPWDLLADELLRLRSRVGTPSYEKVAQLVMDRRVVKGAARHEARIARSTVYDCFRKGRVRVNVPLVREIALALGATDEQVDEWLVRCHGPAGTPAPTPSEETAEPAAADEGVPSATGAEQPAHAAVRRRQAALLVIGCVVLNLAGRQFEEALHLPIYLDMVGTATAAIALGPWRGALTGGVTNALGVAISGVVSLPFALVNVAGALLWGYGVRRWGMGRTLARFFVLNLLVALACSLVAVPILAVLYGGSTGHAEDTLTDNYVTLGHLPLVAVSFSNLLVSLADKVISGFVALVAVTALPEAWRNAVPLAFATAPTPADVRHAPSPS